MSKTTVMRWNVYLIVLVMWSFGAPAQALDINPQSSREISHGIMSIWGAKAMIDEVAANCHRLVPAMSDKFRVASDAWAMRNRDALHTAAFVHERFMAVLGRYVQIRADRIMSKQFRKVHLVRMGTSQVVYMLKILREKFTEEQICVRMLAAIESRRFDPQSMSPKSYQALLHYKRKFEQSKGTHTARRKAYPDGRGGRLRFPLGDKSFADRVTAFEIGTPAARDTNPRNGRNILGKPNYRKGNDRTYTTLGCRGTIIVRFSDNVLVDGAGADLHVFEIGDQVEPTHLWISADGKGWIDVGQISGGRTAIDIAPFVRPGDIFRSVKLTDLGAGCASNWPGADIDAVGAINSVATIVLFGDMLFPPGQTELEVSAADLLDEIVVAAREIHRARIYINARTDGGRSAAENEKLSASQAAAIQTYLSRSLKGSYEFEVRGLGSQRVKATNRPGPTHPENRQVEIIIVPLETSAK